MKDKTLLLVGQLPEPITGESISNELVISNLSSDFNVLNVNTCIIESVNEVGGFSFKKSIKAWVIIAKALFCIFKTDFLYCTPGQTFFGLLRFSPIVLIALLLRKKIFLHWHGYGVYEIFKQYKFFTMIYFNKNVNNVLLTKDLKSKIESLNINTINTTVIRNFCDDLVYVNKENPEKLNILYLGGLMEEKGIEQFIYVANKASNFANFHVCGSGNSTIIEKLTLSQNEGHLTYHGVVSGEDKTNIWANTQIFVLQTYHPTEGVPLTILEAMANQCAVLTTNHNGIPETVADTAMYLEPKSSDSLYDAILRLDKNRDLLVKMQDKAFERSKLFSKSEFKKNILSLFMKT